MSIQLNQDVLYRVAGRFFAAKVSRVHGDECADLHVLVPPPMEGESLPFTTSECEVGIARRAMQPRLQIGEALSLGDRQGYLP